MNTYETITECRSFIVIKTYENVMRKLITCIINMIIKIT